MKVFISYAHANEILARKVTKALEQAGLDVWDADREIMPGDNWAEKIAEGLGESEAMVVLLTPESIKSKAVRHEIEYALGSKSFNRRLIPVLVGSPEKFSSNSIPWILRRLRLINLPENSQEEGIQQITQALQEVA
ncbi:MAG TPA: toll/interleukin-1 receptor domain-containing protein [Pyrinomonadaceae bacterium]|nr:toll/interleukin-1 receptor domain-containing protein [Pyrinomonadaceae bacterium]